MEKNIIIFLFLTVGTLFSFAQKRVIVKTCELNYGTKLGDNEWVMEPYPISYVSTITIDNNHVDIELNKYFMHFYVIKIVKTYYPEFTDFHLIIKDKDENVFNLFYLFEKNIIKITYPDGDGKIIGTFYNINTIRYKY